MIPIIFNDFSDTSVILETVWIVEPGTVYATRFPGFAIFKNITSCLSTTVIVLIPDLALVIPESPTNCWISGIISAVNIVEDEQHLKLPLHLYLNMM